MQALDGLFSRDPAIESEGALTALQSAVSSLGLRIAAKDVENAHHSAMLLGGGIRIQQGDFLATVMDIDETTRFLGAAEQRRTDLSCAGQ